MHNRFFNLFFPSTWKKVSFSSNKSEFNRRNLSVWLFGLFISILITGCSFKSVFEDTASIPKGIWNRNQKVAFRIPVTDTISNFNLVLSIRNTNDYPKSNLILFVDMQSPKGNLLRDTIDIEMCDSKGRWLGKGIGGLWQKIFYRKSVRFPVSGTYTIQFMQAMRMDNLPGISDIGITIEKSK